MKITKEIAQKVLSVVDKGLCYGLGQPEPGKMCVEAAVCYAIGEEHGDKPSCVNEDLSDFKISLNDNKLWETDKKRANGLRRLAIAQLGTASSNFNFNEFQFRLSVKLNLFNHFFEKCLEGHELNKYLVEELKQAKSFDKFDGILCKWRNYSNDCYYYTNDIIQDTFDTIYDEDWNLNKIKKACETAVQVLTEMKTPGSKYLYLTEK